MDESPLTRLLLTALLAAFLGAPASWAAGSNDTAVLTTLETKLFFRSYAKDELSVRLSRIEKRMYGDELGGTVEERLARLAESQNIPFNPYAQSQPAAKPAPVEAQTVESRTLQQPERQSEPADSKVNELEEQDCAIDRAKVAVRAAKDEEISRLLAEGVGFWRNRRSQEAIEKFEQVVRLDPNNAQAHFSMGIIEESQGNFVEALASYKKASQARPNNTEYRDAMLAAEQKFNTKQASVEKRSEISRLAEDATAAYKRGEYLSALDLYKTMDQKTPRQALVKYNIGTIYLVMKQPERALAYYKEARKLSPNEPRYVEAYEHLQSAVNNDENQRKRQYGQYKQQAKFNTVKPTVAPMNEGAMASFGILGRSQADGVLVTTVGLASKALKAGIQRGDIIKSVDGTMVKNTKELNELLSQKPPGQPVQLIVQRARALSQVVL
jgi:tetratricopeptide (TPR) repeat protein